MPLAGSAPYFNKVAGNYASWYCAPSPSGFALRMRREKVLELLGREKGKVLDVGCGPGVMTRELIDLGWEFWGIDVSSNMILECYKLFDTVDRAHFAVGDAARLPFPTGCFDAVICTGVIDRLPSAEEAIKEMARVTRDNGTLILAFPNLLSPYAAWKNFVYYPILARLRPIYYRLAGRTQPPFLPSSPAKLYTVSAAKKVLSKHGAEVSQAAFYNFNLFLSPLDELLLRWALTITEGLEGLLPGKLDLLGAGFLLKAQKLA